MKTREDKISIVIGVVLVLMSLAIFLLSSCQAIKQAEKKEDRGYDCPLYGCTFEDNGDIRTWIIIDWCKVVDEGEKSAERALKKAIWEYKEPIINTEECPVVPKKVIRKLKSKR